MNTDPKEAPEQAVAENIDTRGMFCPYCHGGLRVVEGAYECTGWMNAKSCGRKWPVSREAV